MVKRYVIYDCDMGNDDAWGLLLLMKAEQLFQNLGLNGSRATDDHDKQKKQPFKILGITCVQGNTSVDHSARNVLRLLKTANRLDIPVYKGCKEPLIPSTIERTNFYYGVDGFGDLEHEETIDESLIQKEHAVNAMYRLVCENPKMIDFLCVGTLTNIAMCINMYGSDFLDKIRNVYIMGGNHSGRGNTTKSAEFNFHYDPEAAYATLHRVNTSLMTILPWETCIDPKIGMKLNEFRFQYIASGKNPAVQLLNRADRSVLIPKNRPFWTVCDAYLVAVYLFPELVVNESEDYFTSVELRGMETRGQMTLDHLKRQKDNAKIIFSLNGENMKRVLAWTAGVEGENIEDLLSKKETN